MPSTKKKIYLAESDGIVDKSLPSQMADTEDGEESVGLAFMQELGASGTAIYEGMIEEDYNSALEGELGLDVYDVMRKSDSTVQATLLMVELPIRSADWFVKAATDEDGESDDLDREVAEFVKWNMFERIVWDDFLRQALTCLPSGFSLFEKVFAKVNNQIVIQDLSFRKQTTVSRWQMPNGKKGITQLLPTTKASGKNAGEYEIGIPEQKLVIFSFRREGDNYRGTSILRSAYRHWYLKDRFYRLDALKHEKESLGTPVLTMPGNATPADKVAAKNILKRVRAHKLTGVLLPSEKWTFRYEDHQMGSGTDIWSSINHHDRAISKNILAQFMELGNTQSGSRALSADQSRLFLLANEAVARHIKDTLNRFLVKQLVDFNYDVTRYPTIECGELGEIEVEDFALAVERMVKSGAVRMDDPTENAIRKKLRLPDPVKSREQEEEEALARGEDPNAPVNEPVNTPEGGKDKPKGDTKKEPKGTDDKTKDKQDSQTDDANEIKKASEEPPGSYLHELSGLVNNHSVAQLQDSVSASDAETLKKKGFRLNDYERFAPRVMTFAERKVNFTSIKKAMDKQGGIISDKYTVITEKQKADILKQVEEAVKNNDVKALGKLKAEYRGEFADAVDEVRHEMFDIGKKSAANEMTVAIPVTKKSTKAAMRLESEALVDKLSNDLENAAKTAVTQQLTQYGGEIEKLSAKEAKSAASASMTKLLEKGAEAMKTLAVTGAVNMGRGSIFQRSPELIYGFQFSAILDDRTTDTCLSLDGLVFRKKDMANYQPPLHYNCRSILVEILMEELFKPEFSDTVDGAVPKKVTIDTHSKMKAPVLQKNSPAAKIVKKEIEERQAKIIEYEKAGKFENRIKQHQERIRALQKGLKGKATELHEVDVLQIYLMCEGFSFES